MLSRASPEHPRGMVTQSKDCRRWRCKEGVKEHRLSCPETGTPSEPRRALTIPGAGAGGHCSRMGQEGLTCRHQPWSRSPRMSTNSENAGLSLGSPDQQLSMRRRLWESGWTGV